MATAVSTQLGQLTGANTVEQMMSDVNSLKTLSALATDAAGSGDFVPTTGGNFTGNLGIGVTSPSQKLEVLGNAMLKGVSTEARFLEIGSSRAGDGNSYLDFVCDTTYSDYGLRIVRLGGSGGANAPSQIIHRGTSTLSLTAVEAGKVTFVTNNTERMRITDSGSVGIGTSSPVGKFEVSGSVGSVKINNNGDQISFTNAGLNYITAASGSLRFNAGVTTRFATADTERMRITGAGRVGIGTINPGVEFQVQTDSDTNIAIVSGTTGISAIDFGDSDDRNAGLIQYLNTSNAMTFRTSGSGEDMRIDSSGNVGIGTSSPGELVTAYGTGYQAISLFSGTDNIRMYANAGDLGLQSVTSGNPINFQTNDGSSIAVRMRIASTGDITFKQGVVNLESASGNPAQMNFYCESGNAHYTRIQSSPHASYSGNVVLTLPTTSGTLATTAAVATTGKSIAMAIVFG